MNYKFQYNNDTDRENIILNNNEKILIEQQNISEGNFLIFSDTPVQQKVLIEEEDLTEIK